MRIVIGGDVVPTAQNLNLFEKSDLEGLMEKKLLDIWQSADYRILNLEAPITDSNSPIKKWGPNLKAPNTSAKGILDLNPNLVSLANNHVMDYGIKGLEETVGMLFGNKISYTGAGSNLANAAQPHVFTLGDRTFGVYSCAEHEFSIAKSDSPGANPFDALYSLDHIQKLKTECDFLIVIYHGGKEYYRYPSPRLKQVCRKIVDKGADLVLCQHSHCIGCYEKYINSTILYGQGNFLFAKDYIDEFLGSGLLVSLDTDSLNDVKFIPFKRKNNGIALAENEDFKNIMGDFYARSELIGDDKFLEEVYKAFAKEKHIMYLNRLSGRGNLLAYLDEKLFCSRFIRRKYSKRKELMLRNYFECEAHREVIIRGLMGR